MTQEYLSRKIVTAWREDRIGELPEDAAEDAVGATIEGYAVRYNDGYQSWCPKVKFEEDTLPLGNVNHLPLYQQRLLAETIELYQRTQSLGEFLEKSKTNPAIEASMSARGFDLLKQQHVAMEALMLILDARIEDMSDTSSLAALLKPDPLLDAAVNETITDLETPVIQPDRLAVKLGDNDQWLLDKLAQMNHAVDADVYAAQWGLPTSQLVEVKVAISEKPFNVMALIPEGSFDCTDSIGTFGVRDVHNAAGERLAMSEGKVTDGVNREIELVVKVDPDAVLDIVLNKETGSMRIFNGGTILEGATMTLMLSLHNLNRRPEAQ